MNVGKVRSEILRNPIDATYFFFKLSYQIEVGEHKARIQRLRQDACDLSLHFLTLPNKRTYLQIDDSIFSSSFNFADMICQMVELGCISQILTYFY